MSARVPAESHAAHAQARSAGEHTYIGHACHACGSNVRYVGNKRCKRCNDKRTVAYSRKHAKRLYARKREKQMKTPGTVHEAGQALGITQTRTIQRAHDTSPTD